MDNIVTYALSQLEISEEELCTKAFAGELVNEEEEFPEGCPLSHKELTCHQKKDRALQNKFKMQPELYDQVEGM